MTPLTILGTAAVMALAGLIQGLTGFGFAIVAMALLPLILQDFQAAFTLVALNSLIIPFLIMTHHRKEFSVRPAIGLTVGAVIGTYLGFHFMDRNATGDWFIRAFGLVLVLFCVVDILLSRKKAYTMPKWLAVPCGLLGGFFGGAFNIGGPPLVAYAYSQPWSKAQVVAALQFVFICSTGYRIWMMGFNGYLERSVFHLTAYTLLPTAGGIMAGSFLLHRADRDRLKFGVFVAVGLMGLKHLLVPPVS